MGVAFGYIRVQRRYTTSPLFAFMTNARAFTLQTDTWGVILLPGYKREISMPTTLGAVSLDPHL